MARARANIATNLTSAITLNDGVNMPLFGLGTYNLTEQGEGAALAAMRAALKYMDTECWIQQTHMGEHTVLCA